MKKLNINMPTKVQLIAKGYNEDEIKKIIREFQTLYKHSNPIIKKGEYGEDKMLVYAIIAASNYEFKTIISLLKATCDQKFIHIQSHENIVGNKFHEVFKGMTKHPDQDQDKLYKECMVRLRKYENN